MNKPTKKSQAINKDREFAVVLEGLRSDFRVFGENLVAVKDDIEILKDDVSILKIDIKTIKVRLDSLEFKVDVIGKELSVQKKSMAENNSIVQDHGNRITVLETAATK